MKNFSKSRFFVTILWLFFSSSVIAISFFFIKFDVSVQNLLPEDEKAERSAALTAGSYSADKLILYIEVTDDKYLEKAVSLINHEISRFEPRLKQGIPGTDDIIRFKEYSQSAGILLYPYEFMKNPFTIIEVDRRLKSKETYLHSNPLFSGGDDFFLDPLMMGHDFFNLLNSASNGKYNPQYGGVISQNGKAFIKIFKTGITPDYYETSRKISDLDGRISEISRSNNFVSFLYGDQLFHHDSYKSLAAESRLFAAISIIFIFTVFLFFFRKPQLLLFGIVPYAAGAAVTILIIALFKKNFGGLTFIIGLAIEVIAAVHIVIYLSRINDFSNLKSLRKRIGGSMFLGYLATAVILFVFLFSGMKSLREISLFGLISISVSFLTAWFVLQNMVRPENFSFVQKIINFDPANKYLFFTWAFLAVIFIFGIFFTKFEKDISNLDKEHPFLDFRAKTMKKNFNEPSGSIFLCFTGKNRDDILDNSLEAFKVVWQEKPESAFITPALFYPPERIRKDRIDFIKSYFNREGFLYYLNKTNFANRSFDPWLDTIKGIDKYMLPKPPDYFKDEMDSMFVAYKNREYLLIQMQDRDVTGRVSSILAKNRINFFVVDSLADSARSLVKFESTALILLCISLFLIFLILMIAYRNPLDPLLSILPAVIGLISCYSIAGFTGRGFNIIHAVSSIITAGIGVHYGIYAVSMFRNNNDAGEMRSTIRSLMICTLCIIAVFGTLTVSSNSAVFSLGSSMLSGVVMEFLTAYCGIPYLMNARRKKASE